MGLGPTMMLTVYDFMYIGDDTSHVTLAVLACAFMALIFQYTASEPV